MTSKRNSRVFDDDQPQRDRGHSSAMAPLDASRRTSRTSSCEDMHSAMVSNTTGSHDDDENEKPATYVTGSSLKAVDLESAHEQTDAASEKNDCKYTYSMSVSRLEADRLDSDRSLHVVCHLIQRLQLHQSCPARPYGQFRRRRSWRLPKQLSTR